jgi:hypothetical protein
MNCPECGLIVFPKLAKKDGLCPHCHADISKFLRIDQVAVRCNYTLEMCNHPCNRATAKSDGSAHECPFEVAARRRAESKGKA